jgi:hypothetical protein
MEGLMYYEEIKRGMAWLDKEQPGWEALIDFEELNMMSLCNCVKGQVLGERAYPHNPGGFLTEKQAEWEAQHGFFPWDREDEETLRERWIAAITARRKEAENG